MNRDHHPKSEGRISRRDLMRGGVCGAAGMLAAHGLGQNALADAPQTDKAPKQMKAKSVIQIFLWGGMSHNDTWDPKPESGPEYMGPFNKVIETNVPGIRLTSIFPSLAKQADKFSLIRSMCLRGVLAKFGSHETCTYTMHTGHAPEEGLSYPAVGSVFSLLKSPEYKGVIPPFVTLTRDSGRFPKAGFLGSKHKPFVTGGNPAAGRFEVEGVVSVGMSDDRQKARRQLLNKMNTMGSLMADDPVLAESAEAKDAAYELILGSGKDVFDLSNEDPKLRDRYGRHVFGQQCLAARKLAEAGVPYIAINFPGGFDTHKDHFTRMRDTLVPPLDQGLAALLEDLHDRGSLESTLVWCCGEFGRGPKWDTRASMYEGRTHWGACFTALVAGGGFQGGQIVGSSDETASEVKDRPVYPVDFFGSIYHLAGIDPGTKLPHPQGLEAYVLPPEGKSAGLLTEIM